MITIRNFKRSSAVYFPPDAAALADQCAAAIVALPFVESAAVWPHLGQLMIHVVPLPRPGGIMGAFTSVEQRQLADVVKQFTAPLVPEGEAHS